MHRVFHGLRNTWLEYLPMQTLAIIGSGIAGLGSAHFLRHQYQVTVFEAGSHIGGHSNTKMVKEDGQELPVDTGFMVYNEVTYPHLTKLFALLDVPTKSTDMSFSVQHGPSDTEWNGGSVNLLFGQRKNLFRPRHWRFLMQLNRFNKEAVAALDEPRWSEMTLEQYVAARGYGQDFLHRYLIPMAGAVWSTPPELMQRFPAITLLRFWHNHGFLGLHTQHPWRTVDGGSQQYVRRLIAPFRDCIHVNTPVQQIRRRAGQVEVVTKDSQQTFDHVLLATHGDQALRLLEHSTDLERRLLSAFRYQANATDLHSDSRIMPRTRRCWASWNYRSQGQRDDAVDTTVHYWMNRLQGVSQKRDYFVSLNARQSISAAEVHYQMEYEHPLFDLQALAAQRDLPQLNELGSQTHTWFAGSYFRYGFHEDALLSAVNVSQRMLGRDPWASA
jgi:uncharacterized protein